jgi:nucleoside-diphosphate-sugar epimerase
MRVVVTGGTGNVGSSVVRTLAEDPDVESVLGLARRRPEWAVPGVSWAEADVSRGAAELSKHFQGADAVIHLAWLIQPSRDERTTRAVNVDGSAAVFAAVTQAEVPRLVYASSVGAYSEGPKDHAVDESWPTDGV